MEIQMNILKLYFKIKHKFIEIFFVVLKITIGSQLVLPNFKQITKIALLNGKKLQLFQNFNAFIINFHGI